MGTLHLETRQPLLGWRPLHQALTCFLLMGALTCWGCASAGGGSSDGSEDGTTTDTSTTRPDTSGPTGGNEAPLLDRIGNRRAPIGKQLQIEVSATDPDGDPLTYSVFGDLPDGGKFSKETRTFEWTPTAADDGKLIILTFAVSDGVDEDRETIQITVTTSDEKTGPVLQEIGDVFVEVGTPYELTLQATDEDGDKLTFSTVGPLPPGAVLDPKSGVMTWTPSADEDGMTFRVTFVASDGDQTAQADARFLVQTAELELLPMRPVEVVLGETLTFEIPVNNPQDFPVSCTLTGDPIPGATLEASTCTLTYSPTDPTLVGTSVEFDIALAANGNGVDYNLVGALTVFVVDSGTTTQCQPDGNEPNDDPDQASAITAGTLSGLTICGDEDWYAVDTPAGATLTVTAAFTHGPNGDLDLYVYAPGGQEPAAAGDSSTDNESVVVNGTVAGTYLIRVFEFADGENNYDLTVAVETTGGCANDSREPNDSFAAATPLGGGNTHNIDNGMLCPGDFDLYAFDVTSGSRVQLTLAFDHSQGDLDLELYDPAQNLVAFSRSTSDEEHIDVAGAPSTGTYVAAVYGYQNAMAPYLLEITQSSGVSCTPDASEPNDDVQNAASIPSGSPTLSLTYCGDADFFVVPLTADETLQVDMTWTDASGSAQMYLLDPSGAVVLRGATPRPGGGLRIEFPGDPSPRNYLLEVSDATLALAYTLDVQRSAASCDALSCPTYTVCDDTGQCVSDFCMSDADCPSDYRCRQTFCVDACFTSSDCRTSLDYACRVLEPTDALAFCAPTGPGTTGEGCGVMEDCGATMACLNSSRFPLGMCAAIGCASDSDCDAASTCVDVDNTPICMPFCFADSDCRDGEGYTCQALPSVGTSGSADVCIQ